MEEERKRRGKGEEEGRGDRFGEERKGRRGREEWEGKIEQKKSNKNNII